MITAEAEAERLYPSSPLPAYTYYPEQKPELKIILRKLYPDPDQCLQGTWDAYWNKEFPTSCQGLTCFHPYYDGFESPGKI